MNTKTEKHDKNAKSTVAIEPDLHREIRVRVAAEGRKLGEYVNSLLRMALALEKKGGK